MRIVIVTYWYSEKMGYAENCLSKAIAALGHEVHVVTSTAQVYYDKSFYSEIYEPFLGPRLVQPGEKKENNVIIHRLPIIFWWKRIHVLKGFFKKIFELQPEIVQTFDAITFTTFGLAILKPLLKYKLFTANHTVGSVYPAYNSYREMSLMQKICLRLTDTLLGSIVGFYTTRSFGTTDDASEIAVRFFGIPEQKILTDPLGVDTDIFYPIRNETSLNKRKILRKQLNFSDSDIVCIYTGRFTIDKNPLCLAQSISELNKKGYNFRGLFIGNGPQENEIKKCLGCSIRSFVCYSELAEFYRASDIGVWPRQESTSMIDASASGLPIVISDKVIAEERVDGNGLTYIENDSSDLMRVLKYLQDLNVRNHLGMMGAEKMKNKYSWMSIAKRRIAEYQLALRK